MLVDDNYMEYGKSNQYSLYNLQLPYTKFVLKDIEEHNGAVTLSKDKLINLIFRAFADGHYTDESAIPWRFAAKSAVNSEMHHVRNWQDLVSIDYNSKEYLLKKFHLSEEEFNKLGVETKYNANRNEFYVAR